MNWSEVQVSPDPAAHVQVTGRDARGRKQYLYHPDWHAAQTEFKCERLLALVRALPGLRECVDTDLSQPGLPKRKVAAGLVRLLEIALVEVGKWERRRRSGSAPVHRRPGNNRVIDVQNRKWARVVKRWQDLPRQVSFHYLDRNGQRRTLLPAHLEDYLLAATGERFSAKDLRTCARLAFDTMAWAEMEALLSTRGLDHAVLELAEPVAPRLGRVPLRRADPTVPAALLEAHLRGSLIAARAPADIAGPGDQPRPTRRPTIRHLELAKAPGH